MDENLTGKSILAELAEIEARVVRAHNEKMLEAIAHLAVAANATVMPKSDMLTGGKPILLLPEEMYERLMARYGRPAGSRRITPPQP